MVTLIRNRTLIYDLCFDKEDMTLPYILVIVNYCVFSFPLKVNYYVCSTFVKKKILTSEISENTRDDRSENTKQKEKKNVSTNILFYNIFGSYLHL